MAVRNGDLLQGTHDLLVLKVLGAGPNHGYGIATRLHQLSDDVLRVEEGSLYPALYRMEEQGLIEAEWRPTQNNRNAKFYALTRKGRRAAQAELDGWLRLSGAVARVLRALEQEASYGPALAALHSPCTRRVPMALEGSRHGARDDVPYRFPRP